MMNLSPSLACKLLFRFSIVCLSWFTLLSCSSAPTQYGQSTTTVAQASNGESATKADSIYETYKPTKSELPEELKGTDTSDDNQDEIGIIASLKPASHYDFSSETKQVFINWVNADTDGNRLDTIKEYYDYLYTNAGYVPPMEQLLRSARSWLMCGFEPYGIPPKEYWESMLGTVKLLKYLIEGGYLPQNFELVSVYRNQQLNRCAKGSKRSKHIINAAVDIKINYKNEMERSNVEDGLCYFWHEQGHLHKLGLGLYKSGTIHIDTQGQRTWGSTYSKRSSKCLKSKFLQKN